MSDYRMIWRLPEAKKVNKRAVREELETKTKTGEVLETKTEWREWEKRWVFRQWKVTIYRKEEGAQGCKFDQRAVANSQKNWNRYNH